MQIEALEIKNYRLFRDAKLVDLPRLTMVVGANGSGKSTLFDIFSFLKEALNHNIAQSAARRSPTNPYMGRKAPGKSARSSNWKTRACRPSRGWGSFASFVFFPNSGVCLRTGIFPIFTSAMPGRAPKPVIRSIFPPAVTTWPRWRSTCSSATRNALNGYLKRCVSACPGWRRSRQNLPKTAGSCSGFRTAASRIPFIARCVSDGTIKMFAYLVLLYDPRPHPLLTVEEPEGESTVPGITG